MGNHQTVRLQRGAHGSPDDGVCVMELASMLAGEEFSDRPQSVSPLLTRFLRLYNDRVDDERRQDLYAYAARVVGSRASRAIERTRARLCIGWLEARGEYVPWLTRMLPSPTTGALAARHAACDGSPEAHREALALMDELIECGDGWAGTPADAAELFAGPAPDADVKSV